MIDSRSPEEPTQPQDQNLGAAGEVSREIVPSRWNDGSWQDDTPQEQADIINAELHRYFGEIIPGGEFDPSFISQEINDRLNRHQIDMSSLLAGMFLCIPDIQEPQFNGIIPNSQRDSLGHSKHIMGRLDAPARFIRAFLGRDITELEKMVARDQEMDEVDALMEPLREKSAA